MSLRPLCCSIAFLLFFVPAVFSQTVWSYCYYIVGSAQGVTYVTSVSGSLTTASTAATLNGRSAYNVTGISGTRVYSDSTGRSSSSAISGLAPANANFSTVDQVVYGDWPSIDSNGLLYSFTGTAQTPYGPVSGSPVIRLWVDAINSTYSELIARTRFNEELRTTNGTVDFDSTGGDFVLVNDGGSSASAGTIANQCSLTYGTSTTYSFCYYAATDPSLNSASSYSVLSSGTLTATGPVTRRGRTAYIVQTAAGTRTLTTNITSTSAGTAQQQAIVGVRGIDQDETTGFLYNDNAIYPSASPYLDDEGVVFVLSGNAVYPTKTVATTDVQIYHGDIQQLYNEITPFTPAPAYDYGYITTNVSYVQFSTSASAATLAAANCQYNAAAATVGLTHAAVLWMVSLGLTVTVSAWL